MRRTGSGSTIAPSAICDLTTVNAAKLLSPSPSQRVSDVTTRSLLPVYLTISFLFFSFPVSHIFPIGQMNHERRRIREACETAAATASTIFHTVSSACRSSSLMFYDLTRSCCSLAMTGTLAEATCPEVISLPAHSVDLDLLQVTNTKTICTLLTSVPFRADRTTSVVAAPQYPSTPARR